MTTNTKSRRYARSTPMVSATLRRHDEQITNLTFQVNQIKEKNTALVKTINALNKRLVEISNENADLKKRVATLSLALKQEKSARVAEMNTLMKEVAKQTAAALAAAARTRAAALAASSSRKGGRRPAGPVGKGQFYVHTVESGATLGAIAKAYKVTVSEIKRANRLASDKIRVGQKLYIPKR
jgi:LysM repeat protein